jgi:hypothetical protein
MYLQMALRNRSLLGLTPGDWSTIPNPEDTARHVCSANQWQYHQAFDTPFALEPLSSYLGLDADEPGATDLLKGNLPGEDILSLLQPETIQMLCTMSRQHSLAPKEITIEITPDMFCSCYNTVKEKTSSSPSVHHVGHYKATTYCELLVELHSTMMSIPFQAGFPPAHWHNVIDVTLEKQVGCQRIHHL